MYDEVYKSYAKVNIFLKIAKKRDNYHEIVSRFARVHNLYDEISFFSSNKKAFSIIGNFSCPLEKNTVYKIYNLIKKYKNVENFFKEYSVKIEKNIPEFAGLGGGSSNAATFLLMVNKYCELNLSKDQMCEIALSVGADVPFFIYEYDSANVEGIGEIVEKFEEDKLKIDTITPQIKCDTKEIFTIFREKFYKQIDKNDAKELLAMNSKEVLDTLDISSANDLYIPATYINKDLEQYAKTNWFFSGSGSSFFRIDNGK